MGYRMSSLVSIIYGKVLRSGIYHFWSIFLQRSAQLMSGCEVDPLFVNLDHRSTTRMISGI